MTNGTITRAGDLAMGVIVIILNIIEIVMIARVKQKKTFEIVLLSLCVADSLFGLSNAAISVLYLGRWKGGKSVFDITYTTYFFFVLTSICHLLYIALDTLWAIVRPIKHKFVMTRRKTYYILVTIWLLTICIALTIFLSYKYDILFEDKYGVKADLSNGTRTNSTGKSPPHMDRRVLLQSKKNLYQNFMSRMLSYFIIMADVLLVMCYAIIIHKMKFKKMLQSNKSDMQNQVSMACVLIAGSFVALTLPYAIKTLVDGTSGFAVNMLLISNSGMNSVIYFFRNKCNKYANTKKKNISVMNTRNKLRSEINSGFNTPSIPSTPKMQTKRPNMKIIEELKLSEFKKSS